MNTNQSSRGIDARWYAVDKHGAATLCTCEEDARETAAESAQMFPNCAPYTAVQLAPVSAPTSHPIPTGATGEDERQPDLCPRCDGSGEITVMSDSSPDAHDVNVCCDHCQGSGAAVDAAKFLAAALSGEKYRHMQLWAEYRNFHRSLCARFGYGHDPVHFRRDLVSLEEAIAAKVSAPAAGDALDWYERRRELEPDMIFRTAHGVVKLDRGVPGDGTKWYVLDWNGDGWFAYDDTIEPGDLIGAPVADHPIAIELARTAAIAQQKGEA